MTTQARVVCSKYFDELEVGETFETFGRTITEYDLVAFGTLTGDTNPQHVDATFGEKGPFGERLVHGALILSYALALVPIDPGRLIALRGLDNVKFKNPVRIGDTIHVKARVSRTTPVSDEAGVVVVTARVVNQDDALVARADLEILTLRAPHRESPDGELAAAAAG